MINNRILEYSYLIWLANQCIMENYKEVNKNSWNTRTQYHIESEFYDVEGFLKGKISLNSIELNMLGDIKGKKLLHLQCHFGQDSISLARMGAHVTGMDISDKAIEKANELAGKANQKVDFICCDIYDLPTYLNEQFDIIFTSYGVIGWLPDLDKWAQIINRFLKPGGRFIMAEFHPVVWMFDDDFEKIEYSYFKKDPIVEIETGTYTNREAPVELKTITWNHSLSEVFNALRSRNLRIDTFDEHNYSPYNCFNKTVESEPGKFVINTAYGKLPMVYSLVAIKE